MFSLMFLLILNMILTLHILLLYLCSRKCHVYDWIMSLRVRALNDRRNLYKFLYNNNGGLRSSRHLFKCLEYCIVNLIMIGVKFTLIDLTPNDYAILCGVFLFIFYVFCPKDNYNNKILGTNFSLKLALTMKPTKNKP